MEHFKMKPVWAHPSLRKPRQVYRIKTNYGRIYYTLDEQQEATFYQSVTTWLGKVTPMGIFLLKWIAELGWDKYQALMKEKANYGTFLHILWGEMVTSGLVNLTGIDERLIQLSNAEGWKYSQEKSEQAQKHILSLAQWAIDYKVEPLAVEMVLASDSMLLGGAIDFFGWVTVKEDGLDYENPYKTGPRKGEPREVKIEKRVLAVVDLKSKEEGGFYDEHSLQLEAYRRMIVENFPEYANEEIRLFNLSPRDWKTAPTYFFKEQTGAAVLEDFDLLLSLGKKKFIRTPKTVRVYSGLVELAKPETVTNSYSVVELHEAIRMSEPQDMDGDTDDFIETETEIVE